MAMVWVTMMMMMSTKPKCRNIAAFCLIVHTRTKTSSWSTYQLTQHNTTKFITTARGALESSAQQLSFEQSRFRISSTYQHSLIQLNIKPQQSSAQQLSFEQSRFRISSTYQHSLIQLNIKPQQSSAQQLSFEQSRFRISSTYQHSLIQLNIKPQQSSAQQLSHLNGNVLGFSTPTQPYTA